MKFGNYNKLNNFNDPRASLIGSNRLGASKPSSTRVRSEVQGARQREEARLDHFSATHAGHPKVERHKPGKFENKVLATGVATLALLGAGALYAGSKGGDEGSLAHPDRAAITKQANDNKNMANAIAHEANQTPPQKIDQADIERLQQQQTELHRPAEK